MRWVKPGKGQFLLHLLHLIFALDNDVEEAALAAHHSATGQRDFITLLSLASGSLFHRCIQKNVLIIFWRHCGHMLAALLLRQLLSWKENSMAFMPQLI